MHFQRLKIAEWQQFQRIDIEFHDRLTILTGANGSGKTTILNILAKHHNWSIPSLATPKRTKASGKFTFFARFFGGKDKSDQNSIGTLEYKNGSVANLIVPQSNAAEYQISIENQQRVPCFFFPSHRAVFRYQKVSTIPVTAKNKMAAFNEISERTRSHYLGGGGASTSFYIKETLIAWSFLGHGNEDMDGDDEKLSYFMGFQKVLGKVLPKSIGFRKFSIRDMEIVLECDSGDFLIDAASGGLSTLIELSWQIFMYSTEDQTDFTVLVDEMENHLHPTMQRRVLSDLLDAFPSTTFIVSTHSPLIVNSVRNSTVYVLKFDENREIHSERIDMVNQARTASEILDQVLGVSFTMPIWAEEELIQIVASLSEKEINQESLTTLRKQLESIGLAYFVPKVISDALERKNDTP